MGPGQVTTAIRTGRQEAPEDLLYAFAEALREVLRSAMIRRLRGITHDQED
jgi:hypothetical protein